MLFKVFLASMAFTASLASAYTKPTGNAPEGNPISAPGLGSIVPVGQPFSINWVPTTQGTVTLVLLKGPSSNAVPQYAIAENIPNSGSYSWTPKDDLAPGSTGYGIQLIDDATGAYQYTTQFGISNPSYSSSSASSSTATSKAYAIGAPLTAGPRPTTSPTDSAAWPTTTPASSDDSTVISAAATSTWSTDDSSSTWSTSVLTTPSAPATTPVAVSHSAVSSYAKSSSTSASRTASSTPAAATGGASTLGGSFAGLVLAAGVAVLAL